MVGGHGFQPRVDEINMALVPRQTGSSIKIFILAAALGGRCRTDRCDRRHHAVRCCRPERSRSRSVPDQRRDQSGSSVTLAGTDVARRSTAHSPGCRRSSGLHRVVDTTYRMAHSPYLFQGQTGPGSRSSRLHRSPPEPTRCARSTWQQACKRSPTRVCITIPTTSTTSTSADGTRLYTHDDPGVQVLDPGVALTEVATLKGVLTQGHRRQLAGRLPVPGRRQDRNAAGQHQLVVRRRDTAVDDRCVGRRSRCVHADASDIPGVRRGRQGAGRHVSGTDLGRAHGARRHPAAAGGLAGACRAGPQAGSALPSWQRVSRQVGQRRAPVDGPTTTSSTTLPPEEPGGTAPPATEPPPKPVLKQIPERHDDSARCPRSESARPDRADLGNDRLRLRQAARGVVITGKNGTTPTTTINP